MNTQTSQGPQEYCYFLREMCPNASRNIAALRADDGNHFLYHGIVEGSILYFDLDAPPCDGQLSCYKRTEKIDGPLYKLSLHPVTGYHHWGRLILTTTTYEV